MSQFPIAITKFCMPENIALFDKHLEFLENEGTLLANSKSLSFSGLIFGPAQERLD
jgi:hypothetical protein